MTVEGFILLMVTALAIYQWLVRPARLPFGPVARLLGENIRRLGQHRWLLAWIVGLAGLGVASNLLFILVMAPPPPGFEEPDAHATGWWAALTQSWNWEWQLPKTADLFWPQFTPSHLPAPAAILFFIFYGRVRDSLTAAGLWRRWGWLLIFGAIVAVALHSGAVLSHANPTGWEAFISQWQPVSRIVLAGTSLFALGFGMAGAAFLSSGILLAARRAATNEPCSPSLIWSAPSRSFAPLLVIFLTLGIVGLVVVNLRALVSLTLPGLWTWGWWADEMAMYVIEPLLRLALFTVPFLVVFEELSLRAAVRRCRGIWRERWRELAALVVSGWLLTTLLVTAAGFCQRFICAHAAERIAVTSVLTLLQAALAAWWLLTIARVLTSRSHPSRPATAAG